MSAFALHHSPLPSSPPLPRGRPVVASGAARYRGAARSEVPRWVPFALIAVAHCAVFAALLQVDSVRATITEAAPLFVSFITPPRPAEVAPPPARPQTEVSRETRRMIATRKVSPSPMQAAPVVDAPVVAMPSPAAPAEMAAPAPALQAAIAPPPPVTPPRFSGAGLANAPAEYPLMSRRLKESGRVVLKVLVDPAGSPDRIELAKSSGFERLDAAALAAVRAWHFFPAKRGDEPIAQWVDVSIPFELTRS